MDKILIQGTDFSFDASAKTITFIGFTPIQANIKVIQNVTDNITIYSSSQTFSKGSLSGQVLTLTYDTTSMDDTDSIQVRYYDPALVQPVSVSALPLPNGAATESTLAALLTKVITAPSTEAKQDAIIALLTTIDSDTSNLGGILTALQNTLSVSVSSLPSGLATSSLQDDTNTLLTAIGNLLATIDADTGSLAAKDFATQTTLEAIRVLLAATLTVQGAVTANAGTNLNTSALALESGGNLAAILTKLSADPSTATLQNTINASLQSILSKIIAAPATEAKQDTANTALSAIQTAVQLIDNFISGSRGLVTEDNSAAIKTALELIDNAVSGAGFNITQLNGVNVTMGNGASGTGVQRVTIADDSTGQVSLNPKTSGGLSIFRSIDVDETEEDVKTSAGQLFGWYLFNSTASTIYVKFYNATASNVTVGTTTPVLTIPVPAGSGANVEYTNGISFSTAITIAATTGVADNDTGAPAANALIANIFYK